MCCERAGRFAALLLLAFILSWAAPARGQDDGPRVYQLAPLGARTFTAFAVAKRGNETPESGDVVLGSDIDTNIVVLRYAQTFSLGGRQFNPFVILPVGEVKSTVRRAEGRVVTHSSGFGDAQVGAVLGLVGSPALRPGAYAEFRPAFSSGLMARVFFPTGACSAAKPVNLGAHRLAYQLGLPTTFLFGQSYRAPNLTALEVLPTVTFYDVNPSPFDADRVAKEPQFAVEAHLTRTLSPRIWLSADMLYRQGGETITDGRADGNPTRGWSAGGSAAVRLNRRATVILSYQQVVERSDEGPDGWFFRTAIVVPFD
jgi:hypothetical protein